jgi:hypothetical protein
MSLRTPSTLGTDLVASSRFSYSSSSPVKALAFTVGSHYNYRVYSATARIFGMEAGNHPVLEAQFATAFSVCPD